MSEEADRIRKEVDKICADISRKGGVTGIIAMTSDGRPIRTDFPNTETYLYSDLVARFVQRTKKSFEEIPDVGEIETIRIRSKKNELIVAPYGNFILIVVQDPFSKN